MKHVISISIGSSERDKSVEIELLGEKVRIQRIGTNGDMEKAARLFQEWDGKADAFGLGGTDLGLMVDGRWYTLHSVTSITRYVKQTPLVDGTGLKNTLENRTAATLETHIRPYLDEIGRRVLISSAIDRWGMTVSFIQAGYDYILGDFLFSLGLPIPIRSPRTIKGMAALLVPIISRLPFTWVYPTGEKQHIRTPKWENYYHWATVIAGDCHYIKRYMPDDMQGKVIATNTTTPQDLALFRQMGVKYLLTTTPVLEGRSFGTNLMEAALVAVSGKRRPLTHAELNVLLDEIGFHPQLQEL